MNASQNFPWFNVVGDVPSLMRRLDWTACAIGPPERWPQQLHTVLGLVLQARSPAAVIWGPGLTTLYNDAYADQLGDKHPAALGNSFGWIWAEIWQEIGPVIEQAMRGASFYFEDVPYTVSPSGSPTQRWYTSSFSPVMDGAGKVVGIYITAVETTRRMQAERRYAFQSELGDVLRPLIVPDEITAAACALLGKRLEAARVGYAELDAFSDRLTTRMDWTHGELPSMAGTGTRFDELLPGIGADLCAGTIVAISDVAADARTAAHSSAYAERGIRSLLALPIMKGGRLRALLQVHQSGERWWSDLDMTLAEDTVERTWSAAERAVAEAQKEQAVRALKAFAARQEFQLRLADRIRSLTDPDEVIAAASELLGKHLGVAGVVYAAVDESGEILHMKPDWTDGASRSLAGALLRLDDFGPLVGNAVRAGTDLMVSDVTIDERSSAYADAYAERGVRAFVSIPLMKAGRLRAILNLHDARPHQWTEHEITLAHDMVDRTWSAAERAMVEAELRVQHARTQAIFDNMTEGFLLLDQAWTVLQLNPAGLRLSRRSAAEAIGRNHWEVWPEAAETEAGVLYRRVKETGTIGSLSYRQASPAGNTQWIEITVYPTLDHGLAVLFRDITEQKLAEAKLVDDARRKDEFLAMLAHELRNPLAPIGAAAELLQMRKLDEQQVHQTSKIVGRQVRHMTSLVDDLLDVSRVTRGLVELDHAPLHVGELVADAVEQVTPLIQARHHRLDLRLAPDATMVRGDKKRLVQVIANILNNAAKYTREGGHIQLETRVQDGRVAIEITDNGVGMAPDMAARAFDLFAQAERTSDRSSGGLGLGLALVKSLVELHHGSVSCESAGPGQGSRFTVWLPCLPEGRPGRPRHEDGVAPPAVPSLRILVVDDNVDAASMLAMLLEASGHEVLVEHDSRSGLARARADAPEVCLLDIGLPDIDGNELAQQLRALPETAGSVLIAVTGYGQDKDRDQSLAAGFDDHLVKPVDTDRLAEILAGLR